MKSARLYIAVVVLIVAIAGAAIIVGTTKSTDGSNQSTNTTSVSTSTADNSTIMANSTNTSGTHTSTSSTAVSNTTSVKLGNYSSFISSAGLKLGLSISLITVLNHQNFSLSVQVANVGSSTRNLTSKNNWAINGLVTNSPCNNWFYPLGIGIARGHFTASNLSSAALLFLFNPTALTSCPAEYSISYYLFQPSGDLATTNVGSNPVPLNQTLNLGGYWTGNPSSPGSGVFHYFDSGSYTLIAGDEWGDVTILYFTVG